MNRRVSIFLAGLLALSVGAAGFTHASASRQAAAPTAPATYTVTVGWGDRGSDAIIFTPKWLDVYVGDTVVWRDADALDPHTVSFGPHALLEKLTQNSVMPISQKSGPPLVALNSQVAAPTDRATYDGTGYANSGVLFQGKTWKLTFTKPGTYHYICLIHGDSMAGVVVVHPRPMQGKMYLVQAGDGQASFSDQHNTGQVMAFFPQHLTIHAGDTVTWVGGFHTVTFGPEALRNQLEQQLLTPQKVNGKMQMVLNPKVVLPSGGSTYDGTGFVNSGLLFLRAPQGSNQPPTYRLTFTRPGTYSYDCLMHPHMEGTITVLPAGA